MTTRNKEKARHARIRERFRKCREQESQLIEIASRWEWICAILDGEEVSDFALSFPEVRQVADLKAYDAWRVRED